MHRPPSLIRSLTALLVAAVVVGQPGPSVTFAADPSGHGAWPVPPALPEAPVRLADGTVLPLPPDGYLEQPSVPAVMDAAHAGEAITFEPGARPTVPLAAPGATLQPGAPD
jgi:hypothetical protein